MLREYQEVDKNGFIVDSHVRDDENVIPENFKPTWSSEKSFYVPFWNFGLNCWSEKTDSDELLAKMKEQKLIDMSMNCQEYILAGFDVIIKGQSYHFNYDIEAQLNFQDTYNLFQNNLLTEICWTVREKGIKTRIKLVKTDFINVYTNAIKHKNEWLSHLYEMISPKIAAAKDVDELEAINWGEHEHLLQFNTDNMLDKKIEDIAIIEKEAVAQKNYNTYTEAMLMEVIDIAIMG